VGESAGNRRLYPEMDANFWQAGVERVVPNALVWAEGNQRALHLLHPRAGCWFNTRTLFNRKERKERRWQGEDGARLRSSVPPCLCG
jgi:hypothetical protein